MKDKVVYLTFDDGPQEPYTSEILDVLGRYNAKATFFVCGKNIERYPESLRKIAQAGHSIGNHSYSHSLWKTITGNLSGEIDRTSSLIKEHAGIEVRLYRSPWGITLPWVRRRIEHLQLKVYHWDISAFDWWSPSPRFIANRISKKVFDRAIVLLHDGNKTVVGSRESTVKALDLILTKLNQEGYIFKSL